MKRNFIKMLCLLILGVSLVQCSDNKQNNTTNQNASIQQNENEQNNNNSNVSNEQNNNDSNISNEQNDNNSNTSTITKKVIELKDIRNSKYQSVVPVRVKSNNNEHLGTAFIIGPNTVLTNKHVTDGAEGLGYSQEDLAIGLNEENGEVLFDIENIIPFNVDNYTEEEGKNIDLSIIHVSPKDGRNLSDDINIFQLASIEEVQSVKEGDNVTFAGYPGGTFPNLLCDETLISSLDGNFVSMNSPAKGGSSGSPLLNSEDKIIGLFNASNDEDGVSFAFLFNQTVLDFINDNIK